MPTKKNSPKKATQQETPKFEVVEVPPQKFESPTTESPVWRTKDGDVLMSDMTDEHLIRAIAFAESRFVKSHNEMMRLADIAELFYKKMNQLKDEAEARKLTYESLSIQNPAKFSLLDNSRIKNTYD
jgi:hypothetical protein